MKTLKVLSIISIVISALFILFCLIDFSWGDNAGFWGAVIYGYFLAYSITGLNISRGVDK
jgi:hypothetical protein